MAAGTNNHGEEGAKPVQSGGSWPGLRGRAYFACSPSATSYNDPSLIREMHPNRQLASRNLDIRLLKRWKYLEKQFHRHLVRQIAG